MRNKKIGQQILDWVKEQLQGVRLLEVEPAETEMATRRIHYYERNGYRILDRNYLQPPYVKGGKDFPLWVMGNGSGQSAEDIEPANTDHQRQGILPSVIFIFTTYRKVEKYLRSNHYL